MPTEKVQKLWVDLPDGPTGLGAKAVCSFTFGSCVLPSAAKPLIAEGSSTAALPCPYRFIISTHVWVAMPGGPNSFDHRTNVSKPFLKSPVKMGFALFALISSEIGRAHG